jgi:hypothetical protein
MKLYSNLKPIFCRGVLLLVLIGASLGGVTVTGALVPTTVPAAYAEDGCDNNPPPPFIDCLPTPTPTPTPLGG